MHCQLLRAVALIAFLSVAVAMPQGRPIGQQKHPLTANAQLAGSCYGYCHNQSPDGCWCDGQCTEYGDCCDDFYWSCSCEDVCGLYWLPGRCYCDTHCSLYGDCCPDFSTQCASTEGHPSSKILAKQQGAMDPVAVSGGQRFPVNSCPLASQQKGPGVSRSLQGRGGRAAAPSSEE